VPETTKASDLSCQGLAAVDPDRLTHGNLPVQGYAEEMAKRGEGHVYGCELIGHGLPPVEPDICCDLAKDDPTTDDDGIVVVFCQHRLTGEYERYEEDDDAEQFDPAKPLIYVSRVKRDPADQYCTLPHHGCPDDDCPQTRLCQTHYADL
jgi:hypothetical protein